jgi:hypothetical protein
MKAVKLKELLQYDKSESVLNKAVCYGFTSGTLRELYLFSPSLAKQMPSFY